MITSSSVAPLDAHPQCIELNRLLRSELAAVVAYDHALAAGLDPDDATDLRACATAHRRRCHDLSQHIHELGGLPATCPDTWGLVTTKAIDASVGANLPRLLSLFAHGEARLCGDYEAMVTASDPERAVWLNGVLVDQLRTSERLRLHPRYAATRPDRV